MATFISTSKFERWWRKAQAWFATQFASVSASIDFTPVAKQGTDADVTLTGVDEKLGDLDEIIEAINGDTVDNIVNNYLDGEAEEIESIIGDWSEQESES